MLTALRNFSNFSRDFHYRGGRGLGMASAFVAVLFFVAFVFEFFLGLGFHGSIFFVSLIGVPLVSFLDRNTGVPAVFVKFSLARLARVSRAFVRNFRIPFARFDFHSFLLLLLLLKRISADKLIPLPSHPRIPHVSLIAKLLPIPKFHLPA